MPIETLKKWAKMDLQKKIIIIIIHQAASASRMHRERAAEQFAGRKGSRSCCELFSRPERRSGGGAGIGNNPINQANPGVAITFRVSCVYTMAGSESRRAFQPTQPFS